MKNNDLKNDEKNIDDDKNLHLGHRQRVYQAFDKDTRLETFSEIETLEMLLFIALPRVDTNVLAHKLLRAFGSLNGVFQAQVKDLTKIKMISSKIAYFLRSVPAVVRKAEITRVKPYTVKDVNSALNYLQTHFDNVYTEVMYIMNLDMKDRLLGVDCISAPGTATSSQISIAAAVESALRHHSTKVIVAHNHPGGVVVPSIEDIRLTGLVIDSLAALDVIIADHIIFTPENNYLSFFNSGIILQLYQNFDAVHKTSFVSQLLKEEEHSVKSGIEYLFDLESMTAMTRGEYENYMRSRRVQNSIKGIDY